MSAHNDQNKRIVEQKYQKFKANQLQQTQQSSVSPTKTVLTKMDQNAMEKDDKEENPDSFHKLLKALPKNDKIFEVMLSDPNIYEISQTLRKEAEEKNMLTLIASFPERYRNLLETQAKFKVIQKSSKERCQKQNKQMEILMDRLVKSQQKLKEQQENTNEQYHQVRINEERICAELSLEIRKKQLEIVDLKDLLERSEKKCSKLKEDYKNANTIILELRQQQEQFHKQTQRLIQKLKQCQQKLIKSHKKLLEYDNQKRLEQQHFAAQYEEKIQELRQQKSHLEQLLQQANIRVQYKQSLLKMSEEQSEKTIIKLEQQIKAKHQQIQGLRENHLEALKTIDELEERVDRQELQIVRGVQVWDLEKQELKKQLQKSHQGNGQLKAELDVKSQLVKMLQKSIECLKTSFDSDLTNKTNQWLETNRELSKMRKQYLLTSQKLTQSTSRIQTVESQVQKLKIELRIKQQAAIADAQKIAMAQNALRKYLSKVVEQEELYCSLKLRVDEWMQGQESLDAQEREQNSAYKQNEEAPDSEYSQLKKKISSYEKIISKLQSQVVGLTNESKVHSSRGAKIVAELIEQNKKLKRQLEQKPSAKIELFS